MNKPVFFLAPKDFSGGGVHIGGGWHALVATDAGPALAMPADGNWQALGGLGFVEAPSASALPAEAPSDAAAAPLPDLAA